MIIIDSLYTLQTPTSETAPLKNDTPLSTVSDMVDDKPPIDVVDEKPPNEVVAVGDNTSITPIEMLKSKSFAMFWSAFFLNQTMTMFVGTYWKVPQMCTTHTQNSFTVVRTNIHFR
jgi:hypothetical protein